MNKQGYNKMSLSEQVNEVRESSMSKVDKCKALIKLGFTPYEIEFVLRDSGGKFSFTFGVEIECLVMRTRFIERANANSMAYQYQGYNHNDTCSYYKFVSDGSIIGIDGIECVSPILEGCDEGFRSLENCCNTLNQAGAKVNRSTGLHVHIGVSGLTDKLFINVFKNYQKIESVIDTFMAPSRRGDNNTYCRTLIGYNFDLACSSIADVQRKLNSRYYKVNPFSINRHGTIEFRQHQGSTDYEKISNWVRFCAKLVEWSAMNVLDRELTSIDEIPFLTGREKDFFKMRAQSLR